MMQKTPAELRAEAEKTLEPLGRKRIKLQAALDELDAELRPLIVNAVRNEVTFRRIRELTGVAANTARLWKTKATTE